MAATILWNALVLPFTVVDGKALILAAGVAGGMIFLSRGLRSDDDSFSELCAIPTLAFFYLYLHNYKRGEGQGEGTAEGPAPRPPTSAGALSAESADDLWPWEALLPTLPPSSPEIEALVVLSLSQHTARVLPAFDSIARRHGSPKVAFVAASAGGPMASKHFAETFPGQLRVPLLSDAAALLKLNPAGRPIFALRVAASSGQCEISCKARWHGAVGALERFLAEELGGPSDSE